MLLLILVTFRKSMFPLSIGGRCSSVGSWNLGFSRWWCVPTIACSQRRHIRLPGTCGRHYLGGCWSHCLLDRVHGMLWSHQRKSLYAYDRKFNCKYFRISYLLAFWLKLQYFCLRFFSFHWKIRCILSCKFQYACIVGFVLILQIIAGILAVVFRDQVHH